MSIDSESNLYPDEPLEVQPGANFKPTRDVLSVLPQSAPAAPVDVDGLVREARDMNRMVCAGCNGRGTYIATFGGTNPVQCARCGGRGDIDGPEGGLFNVLADALAALQRDLATANERADYQQKQQDFLAEDLRQKLSACREQLLVLANENDDLQQERDEARAELARLGPVEWMMEQLDGNAFKYHQVRRVIQSEPSKDDET